MPATTSRGCARRGWSGWGADRVSVEACARLVERGDPDRFLATMAAAPALRARLFPLYAFNLEVARGPVVSAEPMIAEMRLQWWRDVLDEIAGARPVRRHEVATPLAEALSPAQARQLDRLVETRRQDIAAEPFAEQGLWDYLDGTAGTLLDVAAQLSGAVPGDAAVAAWGRAQGLANWFLALPALAARGRAGLQDASDASVAGLAREALAGLRPVPRAARPAVLAAWRAPALLRQALRHPARVAAGALVQSEFARRGSLLVRSLTA
jgi:phytoene synthase